MVCTKCGAPLPPNAMACPNCGTQVMMQGNMNAAPNGYQQPNMNPNMNNGYQQPNMGGMNNGYQQPNMGGMNNGYQQQNFQQFSGNMMNNFQQMGQGMRLEPGMTWHVVLQVFLIIGAVVNLISGIVTMVGGQYSGLASMVYAFYPGMRIVDILYGLICIGLGVLGILTMVNLNKRKKLGPQLLMLLYIGAAGASVLYLILVLIMVGGSGMGSSIASVILSLIVSGVMIVVNKIYYDKRAHLFT